MIDPDSRISISTAPWSAAALPYALELLAEAEARSVQIFGEEGRGHLFLSRWAGHQAAIDAVAVAVRRSGLKVQSLEIGRSCCDIPGGKGGDAGALTRLNVAIEIAVRVEAPLICLSADGLGARREPLDREGRGAQAALLDQMYRLANATGIRLGLATSGASSAASPFASAWFGPPTQAASAAGECEHVRFLHDSRMDFDAAGAWLCDQIRRWPRMTASLSTATPAAPDTHALLARTARLMRGHLSGAGDDSLR
jgi:hypothetical protein